MREAPDEVMVTSWEEREGRLSLPDEDDRHVAAAAVRSGTQSITANLR
jgi:hypothetical protein